MTATLAARLGVEAVVDEVVDLGDRPAAARPGRKVMTLVQSIVAPPPLHPAVAARRDQPAAMAVPAVRAHLALGVV